MHFVDSLYSAGTVGIITANMARYNEFWDSIESLQVPHGTAYLRAQGCDPAIGCNKLVENMVGDWLMILGDDHRVPKELVMKFLSYGEDVVAPFVTRRVPPFGQMLALKEFDPYTPFQLAELGLAGNNLISCAATGSAGMLIRKQVFEKLEKPYFGREYIPGRAIPVDDDVAFCLKCQRAGITVYSDPDTFMSHFTNAEIMFFKAPDGMWGIGANINGHKVVLVAPVPREEALKHYAELVAA